MASETGAANRAPKNVPTDRIETINEVWEDVILRWPVLSLKPVEKLSSQYDMAMIPEMVPVS
jgi:hypothetical protein